MVQQRCAVPSCERHWEAGPGGAAGDVEEQLVCDGCVNRLRRDLARLPALYRDCEDLLAHHRARGFERVRSTPARGVTLNEGLVTVRADMLTVASSWAGFVAECRKVPAKPDRTVGALSRFLLSHLRWLARQSAAADAVVEIRRVVRAAEDALDPGAGRRLELGVCERAGCAGTIYATVGASSAPSRVSCERGHVWRPAEWLLLGRRLQAGWAGDATPARGAWARR